MGEFRAILDALVCPREWTDSHMDWHSLSIYTCSFSPHSQTFSPRPRHSHIRHATSRNEEVRKKAKISRIRRRGRAELRGRAGSASGRGGGRRSFLIPIASGFEPCPQVERSEAV